MEPTRINDLINLAVEIQQIPSPTFNEHRRAEFIYQRFISEGLSDVCIDEAGNVLGRLPGAGGPPVVLCAHIDTVFPLEVPLYTERDLDWVAGSGIGDNSLGAAGLFGAVWSLARRESAALQSDLPGDLWLAGTVGEEGLGNLRGMRAVVDRFGADPSAYIILEGMAFGQIYTQGLESMRYRISIKTAGGHSWTDYGRPSAIHVLSGLVCRLASLPLPRQPRTTLNVGVIQGGTTVNSIAAEAHIELDLRSENSQALADLSAKVESLVKETQKAGVQAEVLTIGHRPAGQIAADHPLVLLAERCIHEAGLTPAQAIGSTDANIPLSRGLPAITVGLTHGQGAHTPEERIQIRPIARGMEQVVKIIQGAYNIR